MVRVRKLYRWGVMACLLLVLGGCATDRLGQWDGPTAPAQATVEPWTHQGVAAKCLRTPHYRIHTTLEDDQMLALVPQLLEGALGMYGQMAPDIAPTAEPMDCYVFRFRGHWDAFTRRNAGPDANVYLQIRSGGYTFGDRFAMFYIGREATISVITHEGWHQYVARHFVGRLPPFLEEGMACMFESVAWRGDLPRWNLSVNSHRAHDLRKAMDKGDLWPLDKLVSMHAGDIVADRMERIDAFYAQGWAFAKFLWEAEDGRYRPAMQKLLSDTARGVVWDPTLSHTRSTLPWNRKGVRPMLEHYLGMSLKDIDRAYQAYMRKVAYEQFNDQWQI